jgi:tRNA1(Val) A37 N6-methylase TrmN6
VLNPTAAKPLITHDRLLGGRIRFDQPAAGYRAAIDPVLLAAAVPARDGETIVDLGSGAGAAALCLAARVPGCRVTGIERDAGLVALANANAAANGMTDRVRFVAGDIAGPMCDSAGGPFDHAMTNPPYLEAARADLRAAVPFGRDSAEIEDDTPLSVWLDRLCRMVRPKGRVTLIHRADRLDDILIGLDRRAGDVAVLPLWPKAGRAARRILVTARPGTEAPLRLLAGLVLHDADGGFSPAATAILNDAAPLTL